METTLSQPPMATAKQRISTPRRVGLVMTYNQRETCISAISSLLSQTLALDLIIVSDDCSTDGTYEVITDYFSKNGKPSNVELYQSEKNLGFIPHFNALLKNNCRDDDLIFYNAGDDISEVNRVEEFYREYVTKGKPRYFLAHSYVTSFGSGKEEILVPPIESIKQNRELCLIASAYHIGASQVFTGALFFDFGPILFDDCYEDLTLGYRALLKNAYHFIPKALLRYRIGGLSNWQKNPLEKKRGRLKSTLAQRAVDSISSGDFGLLAVLHECYSQYGFSLKPHPHRVKIVVVSDFAPDFETKTYSISDHFESLNNVCDTQRLSSAQLLNTVSIEQKHTNETLLWIVTSRISSLSMLELFTRIKASTGWSVVLDTGLQNPDIELVSSETHINSVLTYMHKAHAWQLHSSSASYAAEVINQFSANRVTYLPPLQYIDGPDLERMEAKRGLVIVCDELTISRDALEIINKLSSSQAISNISMETVFLPPTEQQDRGISLLPLRLPNTKKKGSDLSVYDFIVILSGHALYNDTVRYWWSLGAKYNIPAFLLSNHTGDNCIRHGETALLVDSNETSWRLAFELIRANFGALKKVASEARRLAYFSCSFQKNAHHIVSMLGRHTNSVPFFDKFYPL